MLKRKSKTLKDLIVFGEDWGAHPSSTQHLVKLLSENRKVLWVNSIGLRRPRINMSDLRRLIIKFQALIDTSATNASSLQPPSVQIIPPRTIPLPGNRLARIANRILLSRSIKPSCIKNNIKNPVLWISLPTAVDMVGELNESSVIYYCGDDFGALEGVDHGPVVRLEKELASKADLILVASPVIGKRFNQEKTHVIPHGVDFELFSRQVPRAPDLTGNGPIAGFYGSLANWLDINLICETAKRLPNWTFLMIGKVNTNISKLQAISNIILLGPRKHKKLASYSQYWNASLLPFRNTDQIKACNPLKLREYLAAGSPVISTEFPALDGYRDLVSVVKTADEFVEALVSSLDDNIENRSARRERVQGESWVSRAQTVSKLIDGL